MEIIIDTDELFKLKKVIDAFLDAENALVETIDSHPDYFYIQRNRDEAAKNLLRQVKGAAIDLGIHKQFLVEYEETKRRLSGLPQEEVAAAA